MYNLDTVKINRSFPLTNDMKRRLLKAIQVGTLNLAHFPEFETQLNSGEEIDISDLTDEEKEVLLKVARRRNY